MSGRIAKKSVEHADVLGLEGEIDIASAPGLEAEALRCIRDSPAVVLDLTRVGYLDSGGLRLLDRLVAHCRTRGLAVRVVAPPSNRALATLAISGFPDELLAGSAAEALAAVAPAGG